MAGKSTTEVRLGAPINVGGYGRRAPIGTPRPTDAKGPLNEAYIDFGYISEDGIEVKTENGTKKIKDWNLDVVATIQESNECTIGLELIQLGVETAKLMFGDANVETTGIGAAEKIKAIHYTGQMLKHFQWAFLMEDANGPQILDIFNGQVTGFPGTQFKKTEVVSFKIDIELFKDPATGRFFTLWSGEDAA